ALRATCCAIVRVIPADERAGGNGTIDGHYEWPHAVQGAVVETGQTAHADAPVHPVSFAAIVGTAAAPALARRCSCWTIAAHRSGAVVVGPVVADPIDR